MDMLIANLNAPRQLAWGPLCWLTYFAILTDSPYRHVNQAVVCAAHLYGVALYYGTNWGDFGASGVSYSRPEFRYYWVYYVGLNAPWAVIPLGNVLTFPLLNPFESSSSSSSFPFSQRLLRGLLRSRTPLMRHPVFLHDSYRQTAGAFRALKARESMRKAQ